MQLRVAFLRLAYTVRESREVGGSNQWAIFSTRKEGRRRRRSVDREGPTWSHVEGEFGLFVARTSIEPRLAARHGPVRTPQIRPHIAFIAISSGECLLVLLSQAHCR